MPQHFRGRVRVGSNTRGITARRIIIRSGHAHDAPRHFTGLRDRSSALRRRKFDSDSTGREMPTSDSTCWMIEHGETRQTRACGGGVRPAAIRLNHVGTKLNEAKPRAFETLALWRN